MSAVPLVRATLAQLPLRPLAVVVVVAGGLVGLVARSVDDPIELEPWLVVAMVAVAVVASAAPDDQAEETAATAPAGRIRRWWMRMGLTGAAAIAAMAAITSSGALAIPRRVSVPSTSFDVWGPGALFVHGMAYVLAGWAVAAVAVTRLGPGSGLRVAGPAVVGVHLAADISWSLWPGWLTEHPTRTWLVLGGVAALVLAVAVRDPAARRLTGAHR